MRSLLIGVAVLALVAPAAQAQQGTGDPAAARSGEAEPGRYLVFFDLGSAALTRDGRETVAEAARDYQRTGAARLSLAGHADSSGDETYNQPPLGAPRRGGAGRAGPAGRAGGRHRGGGGPGRGRPAGRDGGRRARGQEPPGRDRGAAAPAGLRRSRPPRPPRSSRHPRRRRPSPSRRRRRPSRFSFTLGPVYGHNFKEQDEGETENDLLGAELVFNALPGFLGGVSFKQGVFWSLNGVDDGLTGGPC
jgi:hypothetical protein